MRNNNIDSYRAFSFFLVFFYHAGYIEAGYIGVDLFFILSGYLMTGSIIAINRIEGRKGIVLFLNKRISRLLPSILVVTILTVICAYLIIPDTDRPEVIRTLIMTLVAGTNYYLALSQDYFGVGAMFNPFTHMWSISAEIHFYITFAILGFIFRFNNIITIVFIGLLIGINLIFSSGSSESYLFSHTRIFSFIAGYFLYFVNLRIQLKFKYTTISKYILYSIIIISSFIRYPLVFVDTDWLLNSLIANILGCCLLLIILQSDSVTNVELSKVKKTITNIWTYLGRISYSLYLFHFPIMSFTLWIWGEVNLHNLIIIFIASFTMAALNYQFVETRYANLRKK